MDVIDDLMLIKDAAEIERLRHAAEVSDYGFEQGMNAVRAGATENEIAGEIERAIRRRGSTWSWAVTGGTEVGAGERTGFLRGVTQQATDRPIGRDEFVILDLHPLLDLYMADTALPIFLGRPTGRRPPDRLLGGNRADHARRADAGACHRRLRAARHRRV